jgi:acyl carrier protein
LYTHSLETQVENMIRTHFNISPTDPEFDREVDLFDRGYVDSMGIVELLELLQEEFKVEFSDEDLLSDDFSSISGIAWLVSRNSQHESM